MKMIIKFTNITLVSLLLVYLVLISVLLFQGNKVLSMPTDKMGPSIPQGSLLFIEEVEADNLQIGDVICFTIQENSYAIDIIQDNPYEISRVFGVINGNDELIIRTKSDAYDRLDFELVKESDIHGRIIYHIQYFGFIAQNSNGLAGKFLLATPLIIIPVILIILNWHKVIKNSSKE